MFDVEWSFKDKIGGLSSTEQNVEPLFRIEEATLYPVKLNVV